MDSKGQNRQNNNTFAYCRDGFRNSSFDMQGGWHVTPWYQQMEERGQMGLNSDGYMLVPNQAVPYYMAYAYPVFYQGADEDERDLDRMKSMFSKTASQVQIIVEDECDRMEYDGSLMFDEYPDKRLMEDLIENIYQRMQSFGVEDDLEEEESSVFATQCRNCNGNRFGDGLQDLIMVMLFEEMHRRRCRHRRCKRWW